MQPPRQPSIVTGSGFGLSCVFVCLRQCRCWCSNDWASVRCSVVSRLSQRRLISTELAVYRLCPCAGSSAWGHHPGRVCCSRYDQQLAVGGKLPFQLTEFYFAEFQFTKFQFAEFLQLCSLIIQRRAPYRPRCHLCIQFLFNSSNFNTSPRFPPYCCSLLPSVQFCLVFYSLYLCG